MICKNCNHNNEMHANAKLISKEYDSARIFDSACYECGKCLRFVP